MNTETIQVRYVNPPQNGRKTGSIKTADGIYYGVEPAALDRFQVGETYTVEYKEREFNGRIYRDVTRIVAQAAGSPPKQNSGRELHPVEREQIFVLALLKDVPLDIGEQELEKAVNVRRAVWRRTFGS